MFDRQMDTVQKLPLLLVVLQGEMSDSVLQEPRTNPDEQL